MPARPARHPFAAVPDRDARLHLPSRWIRRRPGSASADPVTTDATPPTSPPGTVTPRARRPVDLRSQDGSVATEYGLLAVVAATIVSVMLDWATSGGITSLLTSIMDRVASIVGL